MAKQEKISLDELHPFLRLLYGFGLVPQLALADSIKREGTERTALNLTYGQEEDRSRPYFTTPHVINKWRIHLGTEEDSRFHGKASFGLTDVTNEAEGFEHLETIADELQMILRLPYNISVYRDGKKLSDTPTSCKN